MRKRSGGGGGGKSVSQSMVNLLLRDLESIENRSSDGVNEIMLTLRTNFRHRPYSRLTDSALTRLVQKSLNILPRRASLVKKQGKVTSLMVQSDSDDEGDGGQGTPSCKKMKRVVDKSEERLQLIEEAHIHRMRRNHYQGHSSPSSSSSEEDSEESDYEKDGAVSTSENAIYGEKFEPEFDLTKSMLRASYTKSTGSAKNKFPELKKEEKNIELEVSSCNKIELLSGGGGRRRLRNESKNEGKSLGSSSDIVEVKGKKGPWFKDMGGMKAVLDELIMDVIVPLYHPEIPSLLGVRPMAGILLHGPPGCGKTTLAHAIASETGVPFYKISATEIVSGVSGASEENIRELFLKARKTAPSIVFIDEIDAIASKRENLQREMERRIVTQLMTCMDESCRLVKSTDANSKSVDSDHRPGYVLVIGATNRPDALDPALRRPGRLEREISLGVPDENARTHILSVLTHNLKLEGSLDLMKIARSTPGFVGADLDALANKAGNLAMKRIIDERKKKYMLSSESMIEEHVVEWWKEQWLPEEKENLAITMNDFEEAIKMVQPSSRREGFSAIPDVKWEDVGGLDPLRQEFDRYIVRRIKYPEEYEGFGVDLETGFLLYGPPGCGKTLIAKAVANEAGANFIHIKGPELLNKYVGESELAVRTLFTRARTCAPCILFFDEVDALTTKRGQEGGWVVERLLNQLLIELDGSDHRRGVYVIGATNRPEVMDRAVLRPGRFGKLIYVPLPNPYERGLILKALAKKKPIDASLDLTDIGRMEACENFSGADLSSLMNEAAMAALEEKLALAKSSSSDSFACTIKSKHFELALTKMTPSVSGKQKQYYQKLSETFKAA